jgi:MFS transporter, PHS family, inorganic phosphate transporter
MHRWQHKGLEQRRYLRCSSPLCCHLQKFNSSLFSIKIPALATFWLRRQIAETPRFAHAQGNEQDVTQAVDMASGKEGAKKAAPEANNVQSPRKDTVKQEQETQSSSTNQRNKVHWQELFTAHGIAASLGKVGAHILRCGSG